MSWSARSPPCRKCSSASITASIHAIRVIHHHTPGADEALQQIVAGGPIKVIAPQHPGHLGQHHIREIDTSRSHGSKESPFCDRRLLGVIADQQTHDHIGIKGLHD